jgi:nucleoside-diphosphate-sugar epimerase
VTDTGQGPSAINLRGATCVVTGGYGFIGSNVALRLAAGGAAVRIIDSLEPTHGGDVRNLGGVDVDSLVARISDSRCRELIADADVIFNVAGQVSHTASMIDPIADLELNALDHARFLEMVRKVNPSARIVHMSTRQVYGRVRQLPADEQTAANPVDVNGVAKLAGEQLHMVYAHAYSMPTTSLRLSNVYGSRQRLSSDQLGFLPVFFRKVLLDEPIEIFGDGSQRRDCLHVDDVVDAVLLATTDAAVGKIYNVGHRCDYSLAEIAHLMVELAESKSEIQFVGWPGEHQRIDIGSFTTDSSRIRAELGWEPSINLAEGIRKTLTFYRDHPWYQSSI